MSHRSEPRAGRPFDRDYYEQNQQIGDRPALRWYARLCCRLLKPDGADVFEFGCGTGWLMRHLSRRHRVSGYDLSGFSRQAARTNASGSTVYDSLDEIPSGAFDLVVSLHVLEHVPQPGETIRFLSRLLRPGGQLLFVVPALNGLGHRLKKDRWFAYRDPTHISLLAESEWCRHVRNAGLIVTHQAGDGLWDAPYVRWLPRVVQLPLFGAAAALQVYCGGGRLLLSARHGECLILVAAKPIA